VLSLLPLHAAGQYPDGPAAIDCVISSYTPTIRALGRARDRSSRPALGSGKAIVALAETPGEAKLPAALIEAGQFVSRFPDAISLIGPRANRAGVVEAIRDAAWLHFACHAQSDQSDPSAGHLSLHDGPLPLSEIAEFDLQHTELAYLSACETAIGSSRLADESLHIAAAFQLAGYPHVVGTLWTIRDILAARISDSVYERIAKHGIADTARHLNDAVHALVRDRPGLRSRPWLWAGHVHIGP
jgi:CHAT domain-containing protein